MGTAGLEPTLKKFTDLQSAASTIQPHSQQINAKERIRTSIPKISELVPKTSVYANFTTLAKKNTEIERFKGLEPLTSGLEDLCSTD